MGRPILLHYYLTNRCNARCTFCAIWQEGNKQDAATNDVLRNLFQARKLGCRFVDLTGGEPLLHPDLPLMLKEAKRLGFVTSVTTNCLLFEKRASELTGLIDLLHFSLDADSAELHDHLRGIASFDKVLQSIAIAKKHRLFPDLLFTYTDDNINAFEGVYAIARQNRLMVILDPVFETDGSMDTLRPETHARARSYGKRPGVYLNTAHLRLRKSGGNMPDHPRCSAVSSALVILPDNTLALPCYHHRQSALPIGTDLTITAKSSERRAALHWEGEYPFCTGCHINCYMDPSYTRLPPSRYMFDSLIAKARYTFYKYLIYRQPLLFVPLW